MITLLAAITGFISSIIPEILKIQKDTNDEKHKINILDRQIANNKLNQSKNFTELTVSQEMFILHLSQGLVRVGGVNSTARVLEEFGVID